MARSRTSLIGAAGAAGGVVAVALLAPTASAHVFTEESEVAAGASATINLIVPHACEGSPTTSISIEIPESIVTAAPYVKAGWTVTSEIVSLETPVEGPHGDITERTATVTWTVDDEADAIPDHVRDRFQIQITAPESPGEHLFFKTIQTCVVGETAWIEEYTGEGEEPDLPSPVVIVTEAAEGAGHGHGDDQTTTTLDAGSGGGNDGGESAGAPVDDGDDGGSTGLAVAGLVAGVLGVGVGGAAFARSGRSS